MTIAQMGVPGGTELFVILLVAVIPVALTYWVYRDAKRRGSENAVNWAISMLLWGFMGFLPAIVGLGLYHSVRDEIGPAE